MAGTRIPAIQYLLPFEGPAGDLVRALKYGGRMSLARDLSSIVLGAARQLLVASDGRLEAMPLHRTRLRERGFNQCALLARELARATGLSLSGALSRLVNTHPQADLPRRLRLSNPVGAFLADPGESSGKRFVLLDDVVTTGATMAAAATALLDAGAESVVCLAIAGTSAPGPKAVDGAHSDVYDSNL
jgi:ComF family protein